MPQIKKRGGKTQPFKKQSGIGKKNELPSISKKKENLVDSEAQQDKKEPIQPQEDVKDQAQQQKPEQTEKRPQTPPLEPENPKLQKSLEETQNLQFIDEEEQKEIKDTVLEKNFNSILTNKKEMRPDCLQLQIPFAKESLYKYDYKDNLDKRFEPIRGPANSNSRPFKADQGDTKNLISTNHVNI